MVDLTEEDRVWWRDNRQACKIAVDKLISLMHTAPSASRLFILGRIYKANNSGDVSKPTDWTRDPVTLPEKAWRVSGFPVSFGWVNVQGVPNMSNRVFWVEQCLGEDSMGRTSEGGATMEVHNMQRLVDTGMSTEVLVGQVVPGGLNSGWWTRLQSACRNPLDGSGVVMPPLLEELGPAVDQEQTELCIELATDEDSEGRVDWIMWHEAVGTVYNPDVVFSSLNVLFSVWPDPLLWWSKKDFSHAMCSIGGWSSGLWAERVGQLLVDGCDIHAERVVPPLYNTGRGLIIDVLAACERLETGLADESVHDRVRFLSARRIMGIAGASQIHKSVCAAGGKLRPGLINVEALRKAIRRSVRSGSGGICTLLVKYLTSSWDVSAISSNEIPLLEADGIPFPPSMLQHISAGRYPHVYASAETALFPPLSIGHNTELQQDNPAPAHTYNDHDAGRSMGFRSSVANDEDMYEEYLKLPLPLDSPMHYPMRDSDHGWDLQKDWGGRKVYSRVYSEASLTLDRMLALVRSWFDLVARPTHMEIHPRPHMWRSSSAVQIPMKVSYSELQTLILDIYADINSHQENLFTIDCCLPVSLTIRERKIRWLEWLTTCFLLCGPVRWTGPRSCMKSVARYVSQVIPWDPVVDPAGGLTSVTVDFGESDIGVKLAEELRWFRRESSSEEELGDGAEVHGIIVSDGIATARVCQNEHNSEKDNDEQNQTVWHVRENSVHLINISLAKEVSRGQTAERNRYGSFTPPQQSAQTPADSAQRLQGAAPASQDGKPAAWSLAQISEYGRRMAAEQRRCRTGDVHIAEGAKALTEASSEAQEALRINVSVEDDGICIKNRDGKMRRIWDSLESVNASVLGSGLGLSKKQASRSNVWTVRSQLHLEEVLLAAGRNRGLSSGQVLAFAGVILLTCVLVQNLAVRGSVPGWVPPARRSATSDRGFDLSSMLRLPATVGRKVAAGEDGAMLQVELLVTQRHRLRLNGMVHARQQDGSGSRSEDSTLAYLFRTQDMGEVSSIHTGDVVHASYQVCDGDWIFA